MTDQEELDLLRKQMEALIHWGTCPGDDLEHKCDSQEEWDGYSAARVHAMEIVGVDVT